jgi:hypothetical protein
MGKDSFLLRGEWLDAISALDDADAGKLLKAVYEYNVTGEDPTDLSPMAKLVFLMARPFFDESAEKYRRVCERNRSNGAGGGRPKNEEEEKPKKPSGFSRFSDDDEEKPKKPSGDEYEYEYDSEYDSDSFPAERERETRTRAQGTPENVSLTPAQLDQLKKLYPDKWRDLVDHFSTYLFNHPEKRYRRHYETILDWAKRDGVPDASDSTPKTYDLDDFFEAAVEKSMRNGEAAT